MKRINILFFCLIVIISMSCENENNSNVVNNYEFEDTFKSIIGSKIGIFDNGKINLKVPDEKILKSFNDFNLKYDINKNYSSLEVFTVNDKNYIRFFSDDNYVSTVALLLDDNNTVITGNTVCTSEACATGGGCIPNGDYCTPCKPQGDDSPAVGDCKRTTTGFQEP